MALSDFEVNFQPEFAKTCAYHFSISAKCRPLPRVSARHGVSDAVVADAVFGVLLAGGVQDVVEGDLRGEFPDAVVEFRPDGARGTQRLALALFDGLRETEKAAETDSCFQIFPRLWMI